MVIKKTASKILEGDVKGVIEEVKIQIERSLGLIGVIVISLSAMLGSGLFVLPSFSAVIIIESVLPY